MKHPLRITLGLLGVLLSACSTHSSNMRVGNDMSSYGLTDQREALKTVQVFEEIPQGYRELGQVDAARCHRNFVESSPAREVVLSDLKLAAYARGADGLTRVVIDEVGGLHKNCWYILNGTATMVVAE